MMPCLAPPHTDERELLYAYLDQQREDQPTDAQRTTRRRETRLFLGEPAAT